MKLPKGDVGGISTAVGFTNQATVAICIYITIPLIYSTLFFFGATSVAVL